MMSFEPQLPSQILVCQALIIGEPFDREVLVPSKGWAILCATTPWNLWLARMQKFANILDDPLFTPKSSSGTRCESPSRTIGKRIATASSMAASQKMRHRTFSLSTVALTRRYSPLTNRTSTSLTSHQNQIRASILWFRLYNLGPHS